MESTLPSHLKLPPPPPSSGTNLCIELVGEESVGIFVFGDLLCQLSHVQLQAGHLGDDDQESP